MAKGETRRVRRRPTKQQRQTWEQLELALLQTALVRLGAEWIIRLTETRDPPIPTIRKLAEGIIADTGRWQDEAQRVHDYPWRREEAAT